MNRYKVVFVLTMNKTLKSAYLGLGRDRITML